MPIPSEIQALIERLNRELNETEQAATEGLNRARPLLFRFPDNAILIQIFAFLNNAIFFVDNSRGRIQTIVDSISSADATAEVIQERGEYLATLLGQVIEVKINANRLKTRLENWP
ncbi:hypothetical protein [Argonema galeatum]|uniref:hypothetical protein n=1 Tax=Argonema galeatum TaxID=2942762 RepID=UPI002011CFA9|nr:hypothetical protein [Argonema galeatum]MCL1464796.1 hypothetical protein [Argonema galeatum A003/A1]